MEFLRGQGDFFVLHSLAVRVSETQKRGMRLTRTQAGLAQTGFEALPAIATMGGMAAGALLHTLGLLRAEFIQGGYLGQTIAVDVIIGGALGCLGGLSLSFFGQMALHHVTIVTDGKPQKGYFNSRGEFVETRIKSYYSKADVTDGEKSMIRSAIKQKEREEKIKKADEKEVQKLRVAFEKEKNKSSANNSGVKKPK